ncbi:type IV pilin protein [Desulforhopalus sp. IMCC35007]|uniref:type IV pilin protein n=1 Tax=Desulforhopalus sp. IMCC35007 TaxID=2569543 RepID=UPI0010AEA37C|nr:prepilin-type N-terminal cleavage/methylation domain-containing protein [Desulforhopalus sp. IMCC35007]TKB08219.1 prepilin-type N-terminal cleavage/methylation domain-containing protein [Desulforhopalus sp. IMCC35007]
MKSTNKQGFTLIELSIVLVILGLILGTIAPLIISMTKKNKLSEGRQIVLTARDELKGDFVQNRTLAVNLNEIGHTIDPWQNNLVYIPSPLLAGQDICTWLAGGTDQTGLAVCLDGDCTSKKKDNIAFVISSVGHNFNRQLEAPVNVDGNGADLEVRIYNYGTEIDLYTVDLNDPTQQFDDIVQYVTVDELAQLISCTIVLDNQTGQTICSYGAAIDNDTDVGIINYNQQFSLGSTTDNCVTVDATCEIDYDTALLVDGDQDGRIKLLQVPPSCTLAED